MQLSSLLFIGKPGGLSRGWHSRWLAAVPMFLLAASAEANATVVFDSSGTCAASTCTEATSLLQASVPGIRSAPNASVPYNARTTLYIDKREDGLGETVKNLIYGMALADMFGLKFGGMVGGAHVSHGLNLTDYIYTLFGETQALLPDGPVHADAVVDIPGLHADLEGRLRKALVGKPASVMIMSSVLPSGETLQKFCDDALKRKKLKTADQLLTPAFLSKLRTMLASVLGSQSRAQTSPGRPLVAVHVRRGDAVIGTTAGKRHVDDAWYFGLVDRIRRAIPTCDVHVFSSTEGFWNSSDFDGYRERGMTVHLDTDPIWDWAQMSWATVLVVGKSAYSQVPAFLNQNCVIFQPWVSLPLGDWVAADEHVPVTLSLPRNSSSLKRGFRPDPLTWCLRRAGAIM